MLSHARVCVENEVRGDGGEASADKEEWSCQAKIPS